MFVYWFTWIKLLSFHILKKNIESMYVWHLIGLPNSSIMSSARSELFSEKFEFFDHTILAAGVGVV